MVESLGLPRGADANPELLELPNAAVDVGSPASALVALDADAVLAPDNAVFSALVAFVVSRRV